MKRTVRAMAAWACEAAGAVSRRERAIRDRLVILCYHRVLPLEAKRAYFQPDLVVTPEALREQCRTLRERYEVMTLRDAWRALRSGRSDRRPLAAITFDDGYRDNIRFAAPILAEFSLPATFFVVSDLISGDVPPWYDRLGRAAQACTRKGVEILKDSDVAAMLADASAKSRTMTDGRAPNSQVNPETPLDPPLVRGEEKKAPLGMGVKCSNPRQIVALAKQLAPARREKLCERLARLGDSDMNFADDDLVMSTAELAELVAAGHEIGSHTRTHPILPMLDDAALRDEIVGSRAAMESRLGAAVTSFCYPNGDSDDRVERAVRDAGYECATAVEYGVNSDAENPYRLRRWFVHEERLAGVRGGPSSALLRMELCGLADRVFRRKRAERVA